MGLSMWCKTGDYIVSSSGEFVDDDWKLGKEERWDEWEWLFS